MASTQTEDKKAALRKQIETLQQQLQALDQEAIHELKLRLSDARKVVRELEEELAALTGKPTAAETPSRRTRRPAISDEVLEPQLLKVIAHHGREGMNAKQLAEQLNQNPMRVRRFIVAHPKLLKRQGKGPGTKFFLQ